MKKVLSILLVAVLIFAFCACGGDAHVCESKCEECGKCTDATCTEDACKEKCAGHEEDPPAPPAHTCESVCAECGKCTDAACTEAACADKCAGHTHVTPDDPAHVCAFCGKCTDAACAEEGHADKCAGHETVEINGETYAKLPTEQVIFLATWTENARGTGAADKYKVAAKDLSMLVFTDFTTSQVDSGVAENQKRYTWLGEGATSQFNTLTGLPVEIETVGRVEDKVTTDAEGNEVTTKVAKIYVTSLKLMGTMLEDYANRFTSADGKYYYKGTEIQIDNEKFAWEENHNSARAWVKTMGGVWSANTSSTRFFNNYTDEKFAFVDTDGDGKYDWVRELRSVNGLRLNTIISFEDVALAFTNLGYGSNENNGWWNGDGKFFPYIKAPEGFDFEKAMNGAFVQAVAHHDNEMGNTMVGSILVTLEVSLCDEITGVMTANNGYDDSFHNKTITIDGVEYHWSSQIRQTDGADGDKGVNSGRQLMTQENIGKKFRVVFDRAGNVIYVEIVEDGGETPDTPPAETPVYPENAYLVVGSWKDNTRGGSPLAGAENIVAAIPYGSAIAEATAVKLTMATGFTDVLKKGYVYTLTLNEANEITAAALTGTSVVVNAKDFSFDAEAKTAKNGEENLPIDTYALIDNSGMHIFNFGGAKWGTTTLDKLNNNRVDDLLTFTDTNADGKYDALFVNPVVNGVVTTITEDGRIELAGLIGSAMDNGWFRTGNKFFYTAPEGVTVAVGDVINFNIRIDSTVSYTGELDNPNDHGTYPAVLDIVSVAKTVTGTAENVVAEGNNITFTMDGVNYEWSNKICTKDYADGANGVNAGRDIFVSGGKFTVYLDNAGLVVYAKAAE